MPLAQGGGGLVTSGNIVDGAVINADINAAAAIDKTKLNFGAGLVDADIAAAAAIDKSKVAFGTGITTSQIDDGVIECLTFSLSSAQILALHTTPVTLIAAPGANKINIIDDVVVSYTHGGVTYLNAQEFDIVYFGTTSPLLNSAWNQIGSATSIINRQYVAASNIDVTVGANKDIIIRNPSTAITTGNGTVKYFVRYRTVTL